MKPRALDLFCKAGGATMGLMRAGFHVTGVDIDNQPRYVGDSFRIADAMRYPLEGFDFIWASPPCQAFSVAGIQWRAAGKKYPDLIEPVRERLLNVGVPFVIENVPGAPLRNPIRLNGAMFGLKVRRVRLFETHGFDIPFFLLPDDAPAPFRMGRPLRDGEAITPVGHFSDVQFARKQMQTPWMTGAEMTQAIPPAYSEFIGRFAIQRIQKPIDSYLAME